jgi:hypothetical protein
LSDPDAPPLDEARIVRTLDAHGVEYVLVGMLGARLHGATRRTKDFDFCPEITRENLGRVAAALKALGARLRLPGVPDGVAVSIDAVFLGQMELSTWRTDAGDVDVVRGIPVGTMARLREYGALLSDADLVEVAGCRIYFTLKNAKLLAAKVGDLNDKVNEVTDTLRVKAEEAAANRVEDEVLEFSEAQLASRDLVCRCGDKTFVEHRSAKARVGLAMTGIVGAPLIQKNRLRCQACGSEYKRPFSWSQAGGSAGGKQYT